MAQDPSEVLLRRPPRVPTNTTVRMHTDPTFVQWEAAAAPQGPPLRIPFVFQCISMRVIEDPQDRASDVASFRAGTFNDAHYKELAADTKRPRNGRTWKHDIDESNNGKAARTFLRLMGTTASNHVVSVFVPYRPTVYVRMPTAAGAARDAQQLLDAIDARLRLPPRSCAVAFELKWPMCGWQAEPTRWARVELPNEASRRHFVALAGKRMGLELQMHKRPLNEELLATMETGMRPCAHIRVAAGRVVPLQHQVEHVDVEVMDADCVCLHDSDDGEPPSALPRKVGSLDIEMGTRLRQGMVCIDNEENRITMISLIIRQLGTVIPVRAGRGAGAGAGGGAGAGAGGGAGAPDATDWDTFDFDLVDEVVHGEKKKQSKEEAQAAVADKYRATANAEIARFIISIWPLPPSDAYTAIIVRNEIEAVQAARRLCLRFRVTCRTTHNGDGFDYLAMRVRVMRMSHAQGPLCWFYDHAQAGGKEHTALRTIVQGQRKAAFHTTLQREAEARVAQRRGDGMISKERHGLWAPVPFTDVQAARVAAFNLWLLLTDLHLLGGAWLRSRPYGAVLVPVLDPKVFLAKDVAAAMTAHMPPAARGSVAAVAAIPLAAQACVKDLAERFVAPMHNTKGMAPPPRKVVVGVVGSRDFTDTPALAATLATLAEDNGWVWEKVVSGGAAGADTCAEEWAQEQGLPLTVHAARAPGAAAQLLARNTLIADDADVVVAFVAPSSSGTWDTVRKATARDKQVVVVRVAAASGGGGAAAVESHSLVHDPSASSLGRYKAVRWAARHLGLEPMPALLDAEFWETSAWVASSFSFSVTFSAQRGSREKGFFTVPTMLDIDTCTISQEKWPRASAKLNSLADRLQLPTKLEMPYERLFDFTDEMREAVTARDAATRSWGSGATPLPLPATTLARWGEVAEYCVFDSIVVLECVERLSLVVELLVHGWLTRLSATAYLRRGVTWRCFTALVCRAFPSHVIVIRPDGFNSDSFQGAFVLEPRVGYYETEITSSVDVNSLYPTVIQESNLCFSSLILDKEHLADAQRRGLELESFTFPQEPGKTFHFVQFVKGHRHQREGVLPSTMRFYIAARKRVKKKLKACRDPQQRKLYDIAQQLLKLLANSTYGGTGSKNFQAPSVSIAAATTAKGRQVVMGMKRSINEDFPMKRLLELRGSICARAKVPPKFWRLEDARTKKMHDLGGDTDSCFLLVPVLDGDPAKLVALEHTETWNTTSGKYVHTVRELPLVATDPRVAAALRRFGARRDKTQLQRQLIIDTRNKQLKAARAARVPVIVRVVAESEQTLATRIALALMEHVTEHMCNVCFNKREQLVGRRIMGIGVDYIMRRLLLLKKKNYAGLIWEGQMEDDDYEAKQKGMPSIKADTPKCIATCFGALVRALQELGLQAAQDVLLACARAIANDTIAPTDYAKLVKLSDPRNCAGDPHSLPQMSLLLRMRARGERGELGTCTVPEVGLQVAMVKTWQPSVKSTATWETPAYVAERGLRVDRVYYLEALLAKMAYLSLPQFASFRIIVMRFLMKTEAQMGMLGRKMVDMGGGAFRTPTDAEVGRELRLRAVRKARRFGTAVTTGSMASIGALAASAAPTAMVTMMAAQRAAAAKRKKVKKTKAKASRGTKRTHAGMLFLG